MSRVVRWTEDGDVDVRAMAEMLWTELHKMSGPAALASVFRAIAFEVWADAYTHGWSDGRADRNPDARDNPFKVPA